MQARIKNPAAALPGAMTAIQGLMAAIEKGEAPAATLHLVHLRASQINGCGPCVDYGAQAARKGGETVERLLAVSAWRETTYFTEAERAALALAESMTRLADQSDPVPDAIWNEAARLHDEKALSAIVAHIALTNLFNRMNVATRQIAGSAW